MQVANIHECRLEAGLPEAGKLLNSLASDEDRIWPCEHWPAMRFDRPLSVGASGGHGPIGYRIVEYQPGQRVRFRFTGPPGIDGHHWLEVEEDDQQGAILRHTIYMKVSGWARLSWLLIICPMHNALIEDALFNARRAVGMPARPRRWSLWVRFLRRVRYRKQMPR